MLNRSIILTLALIFLILLSFAFNTLYVEGDDALTVIFHSMGRDPSIQPPFSYYHSGLDFLLSFLPKSEPILRTFAFAASALAQFLMLTFIFVFALSWIKKPLSALQISFFIVMALLITPESLFMSLSMNPTAMAMSMVLGAHLLIRKNFNLQRAVLAALLFGFGVTLRWNIGLYGLVIVTDLLLYRPKVPWWSKMFWGVGAIFSVGLFWYVQGISPIEIRSVLEYNQSVAGDIASSGLIYKYLGASAFWTPFMLFFCAIGFWEKFKEDKKLILLFASSAVSFLVFKNIDPKLNILCHGFLYCFMLTGMIQCEEKTKGFKPIFRWSIVGLCLIPWFIGVKVDSPMTSWGPGFEIKTPSLQETSKDITKISLNSAFQKKYSLGVLNALAIPSIEGPRPLGAYGAILLGGRWRTFLETRDQERESLLTTALQENLPILKIEGSGFLEAKLSEWGFYTQTAESWERLPRLQRREFVHQDGRKITIYWMSKFFMTEEHLWQQLPSKLLVYSNYSSLINKVFNSRPGCQVLSPFGLRIKKEEP